MRAFQNIVSAVAGAVAVLLLIEVLPSTTGEPVRRASTEHSTRTLVVNERNGVDLEALRREVRATIRDELASGPRAVHEVAVEPESLPPTAAQVATAESVMTLIASAVENGRWTSEDRDRLRGVIDTLHPDDRDEVLRAWAAAVNDQRLRPEVTPL